MVQDSVHLNSGLGTVLQRTTVGIKLEVDWSHLESEREGGGVRVSPGTVGVGVSPTVL